MCKKFILAAVFLSVVTLTGFCRPVKVTFSYHTSDVSLIYNDRVIKENPKELMIDFQLGGQLVVFKAGCESQYVRISKDHIFTFLDVALQPLENKFTGTNLQVELKEVSFINYVTNFTREEVTEIINTKLNACHIPAYSPNSVFKNTKANGKEISIGVEVLKSTSKNGSYTTPYYLFSSQKIKWIVLDNSSNHILLEATTEGFYLAYFKAKKGVVASDRLKEITIYSVEEATQKFINSAEFTALTAQLSKK